MIRTGVKEEEMKESSFRISGLKNTGKTLFGDLRMMDLLYENVDNHTHTL